MTDLPNGLTYAQAGVDIDAGNDLIERIKPFAKATRRPGADAALGGFGALFDLKAAGYSDPLLVTTTDGVEHQIVDAWLQVGNEVEDLVANSEFTAIEAPTAIIGTTILNPTVDSAVNTVLAEQQLIQHLV